MTDTEIDWSNLDQYDDDDLEAINEARREKFAEKHAALNEAEQDAVDALRQDAQESLDTETVTLDSGVELEVRTRLPPTGEDLLTEMQEARQAQDLQRARRLTCALLAELVESPERFTEAKVWEVASSDGDAGSQWLAEVSKIVMEPVETAAEDIMGDEGNGRSSGMPAQTTGKQSGWQRQR
jgi:hypothetical protein